MFSPTAHLFLVCMMKASIRAHVPSRYLFFVINPTCKYYTQYQNLYPASISGTLKYNQHSIISTQ